MEALPIAVYWALALWGLFSRRPVLIWLFFGILPFGMLAVVPPRFTGGLSLPGSSMTAALIVVRQIVFYRHGLEAMARTALRGEGLLLSLFWLVGMVVTLFVPRLFAGQVDIVPMAVSDFMEIAPLAPTAQNFSQLAYVTVSVFSVFAFARLFRTPKMLSVLIRGMMFCATVTIVTGVLSYLAGFLPLDPLLDPFKTAQYVLLDNAVLPDGTRRVTGLMPEASAYGSLVLALLSCLYFLRRAIDDPIQRFRANVLIVVLAVLLVMSTSSAGYIGIGVLACLVGLDWFTRAFRINRPRSVRRGVRQEFFLALAGIGFLAVVVMATPGVFDPVMERLDEMVFSKTESNSYLERSMWTRTSLEAGFDSYLVGVGLGSTRTSNFAVSILASTGLLGFLFYFAFVLRLLLTTPTDDDRRIQAIASALKWSFVPSFAVSLLIATTPDFGVFEALRFGVLLALLQGVAPQPAGSENSYSPTPVLSPPARPGTSLQLRLRSGPSE